MATPITARQTFPATPDRVRAMLLDPAYAQLRAERTGAQSVTATERTEGDHGILSVERVIPAEVPDFARAFVGETLTVKETHDWAALDGSGCEGTIGVTFSAPVGVKGTMRMTAEGDGTIVEIEGSISASIPFMGGKIEEMVKGEMARYLAKEPEIGASWLAEH